MQISIYVLIYGLKMAENEALWILKFPDDNDTICAHVGFTDNNCFHKNLTNKYVH